VSFGDADDTPDLLGAEDLSSSSYGPNYGVGIAGIRSRS
jgi:hypothetical protein